MTGPLSNFIHKLETALRTKWLPRALFYGLIVAALFLVWLYTDGESVAFVYSEIYPRPDPPEVSPMKR